LYRVFPWDPEAAAQKEGGPLYVPRKHQGSQRHDIPNLDGVIYCSSVSLSAVVEGLSQFSGTFLENEDLVTPTGAVQALVEYELDDTVTLLNLDDPHILIQYNARPSEVITRVYSGTRKLSEKLWQEGAPGFMWPSSHEASWPNVTLFESRILGKLRVVKNGIRALNTSQQEVIDACSHLRIKI
jgi:hypothetical protein